MNVKREDGIAVKCKRRGLKIVLTVRREERGRPAARLANGPDPRRCSTPRCREAAGAGVTLAVADGRIDLTIRIRLD
jgi:hypothetical protein